MPLIQSIKQISKRKHVTEQKYQKVDKYKNQEARISALVELSLKFVPLEWLNNLLCFSRICNIWTQQNWMFSLTIFQSLEQLEGLLWFAFRIRWELTLTVFSEINACFLSWRSWYWKISQNLTMLCYVQWQRSRGNVASLVWDYAKTINSFLFTLCYAYVSIDHDSMHTNVINS